MTDWLASLACDARWPVALCTGLARPSCVQSAIGLASGCQHGAMRPSSPDLGKLMIPLRDTRKQGQVVYATTHTTPVDFTTQNYRHRQILPTRRREGRAKDRAFSTAWQFGPPVALDSASDHRPCGLGKLAALSGPAFYTVI